mmetsp:Transcript_57768/g.108732  ORF Transcript_57768/g.108732 Transcript_57768/m.108732 type:complete len:288 (+) Transcript_57768:435-1298(+)
MHELAHRRENQAAEQAPSSRFGLRRCFHRCPDVAGQQVRIVSGSRVLGPSLVADGLFRRVPQHATLAANDAATSSFYAGSARLRSHRQVCEQVLPRVFRPEPRSQLLPVDAKLRVVKVCENVDVECPALRCAAKDRVSPVWAYPDVAEKFIFVRVDRIVHGVDNTSHSLVYVFRRHLVLQDAPVQPTHKKSRSHAFRQSLPEEDLKVRHEALCSINHNDRPIRESQRSCYISREIRMAWRVEDVDQKRSCSCKPRAFTFPQPFLPLVLVLVLLPLLILSFCMLSDSR